MVFEEKLKISYELESNARRYSRFSYMYGEYDVTVSL